MMDSAITPAMRSLVRCVLILGTLGVLWLPVNTLLAQQQVPSDAGETTPPSHPPSKEQVKAVLLELITDSASPSDVGRDTPAVSYDQQLFEEWEKTQTSVLNEQLSRLIKQFPDYRKELARVFALATSPDTGWGGFQIFLAIVLSTVVGLIFELITTRKLLQRLYHFAELREKSRRLKYRFIVTRIVIQLIGVAVLGIVLCLGGLFFTKQNQYLELLFNELLTALIQFRLWLILIRGIFSPFRESLRPIPIDNKSASQLYLWFTLFFGIIEFGNALVNYLATAGLGTVLVNGLLVPYTLLLNLIIISRVWVMRKKITAMFIDQKAAEARHRFVGDFFMHAWPFMLTAWFLLLWILWLFKAFTGQWDDAQYVSISWWITLAFPVIDRIFLGFLRQIINLEWLQSPTFAKRSKRFIKILISGLRLLLIGIAVFMLSLAWGLETGALMQAPLIQKALGQGIHLLVIATIAYVIWELFNAMIEKKLPEEEHDVIASLDGDGGGAGATRAETLLPLIRSCVTVVLVVFVLLSILHSLGVAITPLLAGAGVVGIALGFGAQKLVQDVLSGLFFLIDDAFRRGEYLELETLRGTVEKISLRSMQLRHHLGAVQTIPYGEIKTVSNLSRDWITMKLELRLSYDTDIEAVRKIIKKVGQQMLEHETYGKHFILPLKSQGVMRVEESALIVRMKFTTVPGEQWVIRREAYRQVRDALAAQNIHFAHREVRVRLPDAGDDHRDNPPETGSGQQLVAGGAATAVIAAELAKHDKLDEEDNGGDDR